MLSVSLLRLVGDMLPHYHKFHVDDTNADQECAPSSQPPQRERVLLLTTYWSEST